MKFLYHKKQFLCALAYASCSASLFFPATASAFIVLQQARLPTSVEYDSNPTMSERDERSVWRYTLTPGYRITASDEVSSWFLDAGLRFQRSSNPDISIDREDPTISAGWKHEFERGSLNANASFSQTSTRITEFDETGTGLVQKDGTSRAKSFSVNGSRLLSERWIASAGTNYRQQDFSGSDLRNFSSRGLSLGLTYLNNEKISTSLNYSLNDSKSDAGGAGTRTSQNLTLGMSWMLTPQLSSNFALGVNKTSPGGNGWIGNAGLNYDGNRHHYSATYARSVNATGAGGVSSFLESDRITLRYVFDLSDKSTLSSEYSYSRNNSSANDAETQRLSGYYSRQLTENLDLKLTLQRKELKSSSRSSEADVAAISLSYRWPEF